MVPSNSEVTAAEVSLLGKDGREYVMRDRIAEEVNPFDYIIVDCPPL